MIKEDPEEWKPNRMILAVFARNIHNLPEDRVPVEGRLLTWREVLREMKEGTPFGRKYYEVLCEALAEDE